MKIGTSSRIDLLALLGDAAELLSVVHFAEEGPEAMDVSKGEVPEDYALMTAGCVILILPQLLVFTVFQRFIIEGMTAGSVKG